jgi:glycine cleavage system transcriptional repressor
MEDSSCTMLGGEFAMILIVSHEKPFTKSQLVDGFHDLRESMDLTVSARSLHSDEVHYQPPKGELCILSVYGSDRPGIVYRVTKELADRKINIADLNTKLIGSENQPVYVMMLEAILPAGIAVNDLERMLQNLKKELNVEIGIRTVTPVSL